MITYVVGNLLQSPAQVLVNPINTAGMMSKGHFRRLYPAMLEQYRQLCEQQRLRIGDLWLYKTPHKWILNFPTRAHWRDVVKLDNIELGLEQFAAIYAEQGIVSASFPMIGAGLGGLDWQSVVRPLLEHYLEPLPIPVFIHLHEPDDRFTTQLDDDTLAVWLHGVPHIPAMSAVWADLLMITRQEPMLTALDDEQSFQINVDAEQNLILTGHDESPLELSTDLFAAIWETICAAGYVMPGDFPGSAAGSSLLVSLLAQLDYVRPVWLARVNKPRVIGLHLIPPVSSLLRMVEDD